MPHSCAFGCADTDVVMHVFPNPDKFPERFKIWVDLVGDKLKTLSDNQIYIKKRICDIHFIQEHKNRNKRLNILAVPSLHLPEITVTGFSETVNERNVDAPVPGTSTSSDITFTGSSETVNEKCFDAPLPGTSTSSEITVAGFSDTVNKKRVDVLLPATSTSSGERHIVSATDVTKEHNYSVISRNMNMKKTLAKDVRVSLSHQILLRSTQTKIKYLRSEICRLRKEGKTFKSRLANAEKMSKIIAFQLLTKNIKRPAQLFLSMQQQSQKKPKGRRFTTEEKILSLSLFKKSPKCYRVLSSYFTLPSSKSMKKLLSEIKITPGINTIIFERIKKTMSEKDTNERLCSLIFDEMSITPQIFYNSNNDILEGFTYDQKTFANHALVFMVKGIVQNFKQPIAYYFTNSLNKFELKNLIKTVVEHALQSGLLIVNTVCDQSTVNVGAITELVNDTKSLFLRNDKEWKHDMFRVKGQNIIPLYDIPHLVKGIRNNLLTKDLTYIIENNKKTIKWEYFQRVYDADKSYGELRLLHKLTEEHVMPEKINKMRVKSATQLFSHSVAVVTEHLTARGDLNEECRQLVDFTLLMDNLFDSMNVSTFAIPNGKIYKGPVKHNSPHHKLWQNAKKILKTVKYIKKVNAGNEIQLIETIVPSVTNLIKTIEGMEFIWKLLSSKFRLDAMLTRNFNQDPIENFFGNIRSYGARNIAPNTMAFEGAFKALLLNNFSSPHSRRANCEEDSNECLQTLEFFLKEKVSTPDVPEPSIQFNNEICSEQITENDAGQTNFTCGSVVKKMLSNNVKSCQHCRQNLLDTTFTNKNNNFIKAKEYHPNKKWLCYPNDGTEKYFKEIQRITVSFLKQNVPKKRLKNTINEFVDILVDCPFNCILHRVSLKKCFINCTVNILLYSWCRSVNRILAGKITYDGEDETKIVAQNYYNKYKHYKNKK